MRSLLTVVFVSTLAAILSAQNLPAEAQFEVVSIKRAAANASGMSVGRRADGTWRMTNAPVTALLVSAFGLKNLDIVGVPEWARTERYDLTATSGVRPSPDREKAMLRGLLTERFSFRGRIEQREIPVYAMVIARPDRPLPAGLAPLQTDCAATKSCGYSMKGGAELVLTSTGITMESLADALGGAAGRVVVDRTNLKGFYAFTLTYDLPRTGGGNADAPTVFTALPEQLGLKLESARAPIDTLVIDRIERPTEN